MKTIITVDEYILNAKYGKEILIILREILNSFPLLETIKWSSPVYTYSGKNVVGLGSFKSYSGLWFFQGALLKDAAGVLVNAQEGTTKALRQWRFTSTEEINESLVRQYISEAIDNRGKGKEIKSERKKTLVIPDELKIVFIENPVLKNSFIQFSPGKQREFAAYIAEAKRPKTRKNRIQKIIPLILQNRGLNDKYRK